MNCGELYNCFIALQTFSGHPSRSRVCKSLSCLTRSKAFSQSRKVRNTGFLVASACSSIRLMIISALVVLRFFLKPYCVAWMMLSRAPAILVCSMAA